MKTPRSKHQGFTLIEVMIVVAIIGILSAIAYPSYTAYVQRSHRAEAKNYLQTVAQRLEQNYTLSGRYNALQNGDPINNTTTFIADTGFAVVPAGGPARYNISFAPPTAPATANPTPGSFILQAVPTGAQANDACGTLLLTSQNIKGADNVLNNRAPLTLDCWGR